MLEEGLVKGRASTATFCPAGCQVGAAWQTSAAQSETALPVSENVNDVHIPLFGDAFF